MNQAVSTAAPVKPAAKPLPEDALIVIPMRNTVLFPGVISPITVGRAASVAAAQEAVRSEKKVGFLLQRDPRTDDVQPSSAYYLVCPEVIADRPAVAAFRKWLLAQV